MNKLSCPYIDLDGPHPQYIQTVCGSSCTEYPNGPHPQYTIHWLIATEPLIHRNPSFAFNFTAIILIHDIAWSVWWVTKVGYLEGGWVEECAYIVTYYLNDHFEVVSQAAFSFMTTLSFIQWFTSIYVYLFIMKSKWLQQKYCLGWPCYKSRRTLVC